MFLSFENRVNVKQNSQRYLVHTLGSSGKIIDTALSRGRSEDLNLGETLFIEEEFLASRAVCAFIGKPVSCGLFGIGDDYIEKYQSLDDRFIVNKASTFFFEAAGDSMAPLIQAKDILIVDRSLEPINNSIIVAHVDGAMLCKRFYKKSHQVILKSDNKFCKPILVNEEMDFTLFGVVRSVVREFF